MNRVLIVGIVQVILVGFTFGMCEFLLGESLAGLYNKDPEVISAAVYRMSIMLPTYFTCGIMEVLAASLRGMGYSLVPMISAVFGACIIRSWWTIVVFGAYGTAFSLYISYPISWVLTILLHAITLIVVKKRQKRLRAEPTTTA